MAAVHFLMKTSHCAVTELFSPKALKEKVLVLFYHPFSSQQIGKHCHLACVPVGMLAR